MKDIRLLVVGLVGLWLFASCSDPVASTANRSAASLSQPVTTVYARGFSLDRVPGGYVLKLHQPFQKSTDTIRYFLRVEAGKETPAGTDYVLDIPVRSFVTNSSTQIALLQSIGMDSAIVGLVQAEYTCNPMLRRKVESGEVKNVGHQSGLDQERLIALKPDVILAVGFQSDKQQQYDRLRQLGCPALILSEWLEVHPLGRLEWVKVLGAISGRLEEATAFFERKRSRYEQLASQVDSVATGNRPVVMAALPFKDVWYVPGGGSYMARLFKDAGAWYPFAEGSIRGSLHLTLETVLERCAGSDIWLVNSTPTTREQLAQRDRRYTLFQPWKNDALYNFDRWVCASGSNEFYETGTIEPEYILADLIHIFHPALLPDHTLRYYRKI